MTDRPAAPRYIGKDVQEWRFDLPLPMPPCFEAVYKAADYDALEAERQRAEQAFDELKHAARCSAKRDDKIIKHFQQQVVTLIKARDEERQQLEAKLEASRQDNPAHDR